MTLSLEYPLTRDISGMEHSLELQSLIIPLLKNPTPRNLPGIKYSSVQLQMMVQSFEDPSARKITAELLIVAKSLKDLPAREFRGAEY